MNSEIDELLKGTNYARNFGSKGKVQSLEGICDTLQAAMGSGGGNVPIIQEVEMNSEAKIKVIGNYSPSGHDASRIVDENGLAPTVKENHGTVTAVAVNEVGIIREEPLEREGWHRNVKEVLSVDGICRTISTQSNNLATKIKEQPSLRIRKLTPKECWRLMGFDDADFEKAEKVNSNTQLYKQAGNSIVVDVLENIFIELFKQNILSI